MIEPVTVHISGRHENNLDRVKRIWYLSPMRAAKVQASLRICAVSPEPSLLAHTSSESRGTFRLKARSLAPLNGWAWAVKICHDGMLEDTNSLGGAQFKVMVLQLSSCCVNQKGGGRGDLWQKPPGRDLVICTEYHYLKCCLCVARIHNSEQPNEPKHNDRVFTVRLLSS